MLKLALIVFQISVAHAQESIPSSLKIMGRGIQNSVTQETLLEACVGTGENDCDQRRLVSIKLNPQNGDSKWLVDWFGPAFPSVNNIRVKESLLNWYTEQSIEDIFSF